MRGKPLYDSASPVYHSTNMYACVVGTRQCGAWRRIRKFTKGGL